MSYRQFMWPEMTGPNPNIIINSLTLQIPSHSLVVVFPVKYYFVSFEGDISVEIKLFHVVGSSAQRVSLLHICPYIYIH